jgi:hypothetical protein
MKTKEKKCECAKGRVCRYCLDRLDLKLAPPSTKK